MAAINYGLVTSQGDFGRVYDVQLDTAGTGGSIDLTMTGNGPGDVTTITMAFVPTVCFITAMNIVLTAAQVLAAAGGAGAAGTYANGLDGTTTVRITAQTASLVTFLMTTGTNRSFRAFVGRLYQPNR